MLENFGRYKRFSVNGRICYVEESMYFGDGINTEGILYGKYIVNPEEYILLVKGSSDWLWNGGNYEKKSIVQDLEDIEDEKIRKLLVGGSIGEIREKIENFYVLPDTVYKRRRYCNISRVTKRIENGEEREWEMRDSQLFEVLRDIPFELPDEVKYDVFSSANELLSDNSQYELLSGFSSNPGVLLYTLMDALSEIDEGSIPDPIILKEKFWERLKELRDLSLPGLIYSTKKNVLTEKKNFPISISKARIVMGMSGILGRLFWSMYLANLNFKKSSRVG